MFYYFSLLVILLFISFLYNLNTHLIIKNELVSKYNRWKKLNSLVSTSQKNKLTIIIVSLKLIFQAIWISFLQSKNKTIKKLNKNKYELTYIIEGKLYKLVVNVTRGPSPVLQVINNHNNDVTSQIIPYIGPNYNWHKNQFTPDFFGYESLSFELADGNEYTVKNKTSIKSFNNSDSTPHTKITF
jgi:hypothetical protein